jgi:hypothetical protein
VLRSADAKAQTLHAFLGVGGSLAQQQQQQQQASQQQQQQEEEEIDIEAGSPQQGTAVASIANDEQAAAAEQDRQQQGASPPAAPGAAAAAAAAAALAAPAARRRGRGGAAGAAQAGAGAFDFMPTSMEIAGDVGLHQQQAQQEQQQQAQQQPTQQQQQSQFVRQQRRLGDGASGLASVQGLLAEAESRPHAGVLDILRGLTWVGLADATLALVQVRCAEVPAEWAAVVVYVLLLYCCCTATWCGEVDGGRIEMKRILHCPAGLLRACCPSPITLPAVLPSACLGPARV